MRIGHRLRRALLVTLAAAAALVAAPGTALAADPPTILTAGIDAQDQLYATWSLAPGTTFGQVEFASLPWPDHDLPYFFLEGQFAGYESCRKASCAGLTAFTVEYPVQRDRRFFVKVTAKDGDEELTSAVWVIDETKPVIPGDAEIGDGNSNAPVAGRPFDGASLLPPGAVPTASIRFLKAPKTIRGLLRMGVPVRVTSSVAHSVQTMLETPKEILGLRSVGFATGGTHTATAKVDEFSRAALRRLKRARIRLEVLVTLPDGTIKKASRSFNVRR